VHTPAEQAAGGLGRRWASSWSVPWRRLAKPACAAVAQQCGQAKPRAPSAPQSRARGVLVLGSRPAPVGVSDRGVWRVVASIEDLRTSSLGLGFDVTGVLD